MIFLVLISVTQFIIKKHSILYPTHNQWTKSKIPDLPVPADPRPLRQNLLGATPILGLAIPKPATI